MKKRIPDDPLFEKVIAMTRKTLLADLGMGHEMMKEETQIQSIVEEKKKEKNGMYMWIVYAEIVYPGEGFSRIRKKNNDNQIHAVDIKRPNECIWDGTHVSLCCLMVKFMNDHCKRTHTYSQDSVLMRFKFSLFCRRLFFFSFIFSVLRLSNKHDVILISFFFFYSAPLLPFKSTDTNL